MNDEIVAGYYIVAFLDILGVKQKFKKMKNMFNQTEEEKIKIMRESLAPVLKFRDVFKNYYNSYKNEIGYEKILSESYGIEVPQVSIKNFSDSVILSLPMRIKGRKPIIAELYPMLGACSAACFISGSMGHPVRGGIELGVGVPLEDCEVIGNALSEAYLLETQAEYPRILLGGELLEFIERAIKINPDPRDIEYAINKKVCIQIKNIIYKDVGRLFSLDWLNEEESAKLLKQDAKYGILMEALIINIENMLDNDKDEKVTLKYKYYKNYVISKIGKKEYRRYMGNKPV